MAASVVGICNSALLKIGGVRISSLTEDSRCAQLCNEQYEKMRDEVLIGHPWKFATKRVELAAVDSEPAFGYTYMFALPTDCLRVLPDPEYDDTEYKIEGQYLLTNESEFSIKYITNSVEVGFYPPMFAEALSCRLAADLAYPLAQSNTLMEAMMKAYQYQLKMARSIDAQQGTPPEIQADQWRNARGGWRS